MNLASALALVREKHEIAAPNPIFLQELRRLEEHVFGHWTKHRLAPLDEFRDPTLDWSESLYTVLANYNRRGVNLDEERRIINRWFGEANQDQQYVLEQKISTFVITGLETEDGDNEPRSKALSNIVREAVLDTGTCTVHQLKWTLQSLSSSDELHRLVRDTQKTKSWLEEFDVELSTIASF
jgi:hypothetical protein